jgi:hypothetical protein
MPYIAHRDVEPLVDVSELRSQSLGWVGTDLHASTRRANCWLVQKGCSALRLRWVGEMNGPWLGGDQCDARIRETRSGDVLDRLALSRGGRDDEGAWDDR